MGRNEKIAEFIPESFKQKMPTKTENLFSSQNLLPSNQPVETLLQLKRQWKPPKKCLSTLKKLLLSARKQQPKSPTPLQLAAFNSPKSLSLSPLPPKSTTTPPRKETPPLSLTETLSYLTTKHVQKATSPLQLSDAPPQRLLQILQNLLTTC